MEFMAKKCLILSTLANLLDYLCVMQVICESLHTSAHELQQVVTLPAYSFHGVRIKMPLASGNETVDLKELPPLEVFFGHSPKMAAAYEKLQRVASTDVPVLIQGESGTGKEILAKLLHAFSKRSNFPWVKVTCPAIPLPLIESELFGYEKGAFTGAHATKRGRVELAHEGTLFLDEVGSLDVTVQAKLLQLLQDGNFMRVGAQDARQVDTRLVTAARGSLRERVDDGSFRLEIENNDGHAGALHERKNGIRKRVGGDVEEEHVDVFAAALMAGLAGALGRIDETKIDHFHAGAREPCRHLRHVGLEPLLETRKLTPVGIETNAAQAGT